MTDQPRTRGVAIRKFSCSNHPDGPPTLPADGWEREELTIEQAYDENVLHGLKLAFDNETWGKHPDVEAARRALGLCCLGHEWSTVGYKDVEVSLWEGFVIDTLAPAINESRARSHVLLSELARSATKEAIEAQGRTVRIPLVSPEPKDEQA